MENLTLIDSLLVAVVGMLVVFFGLVVLIMLIKLMGVMTGNMGKKKEAPAATSVLVTPVTPAVPVKAPEGKLSPAKFDDETVAVITAAIAAQRGEGYPFKIKRIVRVMQ